MTKHSNVYREARKALRRNRALDLLVLSETLIKSDLLPDHAPGFLMRGIAYELGSDGVGVDLERAAENYRKAASIAPDSITYLYLARVTMKLDGERRSVALRYINEAKSIRMVPEVHLAYARFHEAGKQPDLALARRHYLRAALCGRFAGFFGYASMSRQLGQHFRALAADSLRLMLAPLLLIALGRRASKSL